MGRRAHVLPGGVVVMVRSSLVTLVLLAWMGGCVAVFLLTWVRPGTPLTDRLPPPVARVQQRLFDTFYAPMTLELDGSK